ncbi:MAG TPA: PilZ domain-containing protein [Symbiobacteriaceae bacterium]|nr:PilZ domain-containing protein [Symbiobacteriaceae bacterium]
MIWQRRARSSADDASASLELKAVAGLPGRLSYAEGVSGNRMANVSCTIRKVDQAEIILIVVGGATPPPVESAVILEVTDNRALLQCFTSVKVVRGAEVILRTPSRPHIVQRRRFPRVDVFLSVTLHTPDRPIEAVAAQMINLSMEGAAVVLVEALEPGTPVMLNLANLGFYPTEVPSQVRRCTPTPSHLWVIGLQFESLQPEQELYLAKYLQDFTDSQAT